MSSIDPDRERLVDREPTVLEGDDELPRQPAPPADPYTPEPRPRPGAFRAMWLAWAVVAVLVLLIVVAALR